MKSKSVYWLMGIVFLGVGAAQLGAASYNDAANGVFSANATWGGSGHPSAPGDMGTIDSNIVDGDQANCYDTYVLPGGVLRYDPNNSGYQITSGTIHLQGGTFDTRYGNTWPAMNYTCAVSVESNSLIIMGEGTTAGRFITPVLSGSANLSFSNRPGTGMAYFVGDPSSTWTGTAILLPGAQIGFSTYLLNVPLTLQTSGVSTSLWQFGSTAYWSGWYTYTKTLSGSGIIDAYGGGYPNNLQFTNCVVSPGTSNTAGTLTFTHFYYANNTIAFRNGSTTIIDVLSPSANDLITATGPAGYGQITVDAGAALQINLFTPTSSGSMTNRTIMHADDGGIVKNFTITYGNSNAWSKLVVYTANGGKDLMFAGTYTFSGGAGTPPAVNNASGATNILNTSAWLNGTLSDTGTPPTHVWAFWDTTDRGTNRTWAYTNDFGVVPAITGLTCQATGLSPNTVYWYAFYASNAGGVAWDNPDAQSFKTYGPPAVNNAGGATAIQQLSATLNGTLINGVGAQAYMYWGTNPANWAHTDLVGTVTEGPISWPVTSLSPATTYWYQSFVSNAYGTAWAASATNFTTFPPYTYFDQANGNWNTPGAWYSNNGGTTYPMAADTAVITNYTISDNGWITGTVYLNATGTLRATYNPNCALGALHLNGGLLDMSGGRWLAAAPFDVYVDVDSLITNSSLTAYGTLSPINLHGSNALTFAGNSNLIFGLTTTTNSSFSGSYRIQPWTALSLGTPDANGPAGWQYNPIYLVATNSTLYFGQNNSITYCGTLTGNGIFRTGFQGYGGAFGILGSGGTIAPGRPGTDDAGMIRFAFDQFTFASNSTYAVNVASNGADLLDGVAVSAYKMPVIIDPNANLNVKLWTPRTNWSMGAGATILLASNANITTGIQGNFKVNWQNSNHWSNLQVNYDTNSPVNRIYITGSYTAPPPGGTTLLFR